MRTVLIVDDRPTNRDLVRTFLGYHGFQILEAENGVQACTLMRQARPDLVITDVLMPEMDGYELVLSMRADERTSAIPVIFYTANYLEEEAQPIASALGVHSIVIRSGDLTLLLEAVNSALSGTSVSVVPVNEDHFNQEHPRVLNAKLIEKIHELEEKDGIGRDLHDVVIQRLFAVGLRLESLRRRLPDAEALLLREVMVEVDETINDIRLAIFSLGSENPRGTTLRGQVLKIVRQSSTTLGFVPDLRLIGPIDTSIPTDVHPDVLATLREALSNVARHAAASAVQIVLSAERGTVELRITDDGRGLPAERRESGIANLRRRADERGGTMITAHNADGRGLSLLWTVPISHIP